MVKKLIKHKWLIIVAVIIALVVFDKLVYNVSIVNRGIVIGIAVDLDGEYIVLSTQMVLPTNGAVGSEGNNYTVMSAKSKDVAGAVGKISADTGLSVSLGHTVSIVIGSEVIKQGRFDILEHMLIDDVITDNTLLCLADGKAKDILQAKVPIGEVSSYQLQKLLQPPKPVLGAAATTILQFYVNQDTKWDTNHLPIVSIIPTDPTTDQESNNIDKADLLSISRTALVNATGILCELDSYQSEGLTMVEYEPKDGTMDIQTHDGKTLGIRIVSCKASKKYNLKEKKVKIELDFKTVRGGDRDGKILTTKMNAEELESFKAGVKDRVMSCYNYALENNADVFSLQKGFYQRYANEYKRQASDDFLKNITLEIDVKVTQR